MKATINRMGRRTFPAVLAGVMAFTVLATNGYANSAVYQQTLKSTAWVVAKVEGGLPRGSGVLVDKERRLVVTNYHVVLNAREALIFFPDVKDGLVVAERDFYIRNAKKLGIKSRVVAVDRKRDLALIELPALSADVPAIELADKSASPGETVHSVGNPGSSDVLWAYTSGTVWAVYQKKFRTGVGEHNFKVLETQSPINAGDSGGPVVNSDGKLVGVYAGDGDKGPAGELLRRRPRDQGLPRRGLEAGSAANRPSARSRRTEVHQA